MKSGIATKITFIFAFIVNLFLVIFMYLTASTLSYEFSVISGWIGYNLVIVGLPLSIICFSINIIMRKSIERRFFILNTVLSVTLPLSLLCFYIFVAQ